MVQKILQELQKVIIGQEEFLETLLIALLSNSHLLIEGPPGIAKTTAIKALSKVVELEYKRVQFTPDLLPSDIIGAEIINLKTNEFMLKKGPIFTNLLLADEINRASPKVQSALLEAMAEGQVSIGGKSFILEPPFITLATQNPIEQNGTYPLPEAQLDRFLVKVHLSLPKIEDEFIFIQQDSKKALDSLQKVATKKDILTLQEEVEKVHIDKELLRYLLQIIDATRNLEKYNLHDFKEFVAYGASPRGSIATLKAAKALAFIEGKDFVTPSNIAKAAFLCLNHRIILNYKAKANNITSFNIIEAILQKVEIP